MKTVVHAVILLLTRPPIFKINLRRYARVVFEVCGWSSWLLYHIHILDQGCTKPG